MKHMGSHKLEDFDKTFVVQSLTDTFFVAFQSKRAEVYKLSQNNKLQHVYEMTLPNDVINVVVADDSLIFGLKNGLQAYSMADWSLATEVTFQNQVTFLKPLTEQNHKTTLALGIKNDSKFSVLLLQNLQVVSKVDFNQPVVNLMSDNEGYFNKLDHFLHQGKSNMPTHKHTKQANSR